MQFTDQESKPLEIKYKIDLKLALDWWVIYKMRHSTEPRGRTVIKSYGYLSFAKVWAKISIKTVKVNTYSQIVLDHAKQSVTDILITASNRVI